jgi:hypothetical protein
MLALERWGRKWAELKPEHAHPGVVLWVWANFFMSNCQYLWIKIV